MRMTRQPHDPPPSTPPTSFGPLWPAWLLGLAFGILGGLFILAATQQLRIYGLSATVSGQIAAMLPLAGLSALFISGALRAGRGDIGGWRLLVITARLLAILLILFGLFAGGCGIMVVAEGGPYGGAGWVVGILPGILALALAFGLWRWTRSQH